MTLDITTQAVSFNYTNILPFTLSIKRVAGCTVENLKSGGNPAYDMPNNTFIGSTATSTFAGTRTGKVHLTIDVSLNEA